MATDDLRIETTTNAGLLAKKKKMDSLIKSY